ncbi:uncharacterized protein N7477_006568 [Penicillium maclennaniae]|uniref:uncharacterized protein n=1 Tax=Penicillium maclennaniae TaxID=1343394 RepID=UPI002540F659|nr:uncharacterized protein N7477_006568 [Penicillium maclennaniae]KAJ5667998.1 hypothetical protein N7477_006568 [Penicillium maclennaniae]
MLILRHLAVAPGSGCTTQKSNPFQANESSGADTAHVDHGTLRQILKTTCEGLNVAKQRGFESTCEVVETASGNGARKGVDITRENGGSGPDSAQNCQHTARICDKTPFGSDIACGSLDVALSLIRRSGGSIGSGRGLGHADGSLKNEDLELIDSGAKVRNLIQKPLQTLVAINKEACYI